jgi:hypothetical protein
MIAFHKITENFVGADLSAFGGFLDIRIKKLIANIKVKKLRKEM